MKSLGQKRLEKANSILEKPLRVMVKSDVLGSTPSKDGPISNSYYLYRFCKRNRIKVEEPKSYPYDRLWITLNTLNQKLKFINYLGLDLLKKLVDSNSK